MTRVLTYIMGGMVMIGCSACQHSSPESQPEIGSIRGKMQDSVDLSYSGPRETRTPFSQTKTSYKRKNIGHEY